MYLRNIKYIYQNINNYLDNSNDEFEDDVIIEYLNEIYDDLSNINNEYGYHKKTILFLNANLIELVDLYYEYDMSYVIKFLKKYDKDNPDFYHDYID